MQDITVSDISTSRLKYLQEKFGVRTTTSSKEAVKDAEIAIIAVKPQNVATLASSFTGTTPSALLLSIAAGVNLADLQRLFHSDRVIRSMPNTPAMVMEGITVWIASQNTPAPMLDKARVLLSSFGDHIQVYEEEYVEKSTAISGSGPAYVFLTMEAMIDAAVHMGVPRDMAAKLVISTLRGSATYALQSSEHISKLRNNVTSPGG